LGHAIPPGPFAQKGFTPLRVFTKFGLGEGVPGPHPHAKFDVVALKKWVYSPQIAKIGIFGINFPKRGIPP